MAATQAAWTGRARLKAVGARARAERTPNMLYIFVTLEVLKLSGWLNVVAPCRVEIGRRAGRGVGVCVGSGAGAGSGGGRTWVAAAQAACMGRA